MKQTIFYFTLIFVFCACTGSRQKERAITVINSLESIHLAFFDTWSYSTHGSKELKTWYKNVNDHIEYSVLFRRMSDMEIIDITFAENFVKEQNLQFDIKKSLGYRVHSYDDSIVFIISNIEKITYEITYETVGVLKKGEDISFSNVKNLFDSLRQTGKELDRIGIREVSSLGDGFYLFKLFTGEEAMFIPDTLSKERREKAVGDRVLIKDKWYYGSSPYNSKAKMIKF